MVQRGPNVFGVSREIFSDPDFADEPYTEREAWLWMVSAATWKETKTRGNTKHTVKLKRGEFSFGVRFLAEKWQWSKSRVARFLKRLENEDKIRDTSRDGSQVYFISKYNDYQVVGIPKRDSERDTSWDSGGTDVGQQRDKEETGETGKTGNIGASAAQADLLGSVPKPSSATFPDWWPKEAWASFVEMRRKMRKPLTTRAITLAIKAVTDLRDAGHDPEKVIDQTVQRGWLAFYPLKDAGNGFANGQKTQALVGKSISGDDEKRRNLKLFVDRGIWKSMEGPPPRDDAGRPNPECCYPRDLLREFGLLQPRASPSAEWQTARAQSA